MSISRYAGAALIAAVIGCTPVAAQNLLSNPSFDTDGSGWQNPYLYHLAWLPDDGDASGSGLGCLEGGEDTNNGASTGPWQEVPVQPLTGYDLAVSARLPAGSVAVSATVWVQWYDAAGDFLSWSDFTMVTDVVGGPWERVVAWVYSPAAAATARVRPGFSMPDSSVIGVSAARWDDVFFAVSPMFFRDDFESGSTDAWSMVSP